MSHHIMAHQYPCSCGSGKTIVNCCVSKVETTIPPLPKTGYSNPKCYASGLNDCSDEISKEHFLSKSVVKLINIKGKKMKISGPKWIPDNTEMYIGINSLGSKTLCRRHNSSLHTLDDVGKKFVEFLIAPTLSKKISFINGDEIERWMLKILCGQIASNWHQPHTDNWKPSLKWLDVLFSNNPTPLQYGLYLISGKITQKFHQIGTWILTQENSSEPNGLLFIVAGYIFVFFIDNINGQLFKKIKGDGMTINYRPECIIIFDGVQRELHLGKPPWSGNVYIEDKPVKD